MNAWNFDAPADAAAPDMVVVVVDVGKGKERDGVAVSQRGLPEK